MAKTGEDLYRRYRKGDAYAFDELIELYRERLIFFLLRYLPRVEDAEEAAQDAFVALLLHPWRERGASLKTYLFTIARNRALNERKRQKRQAAFELGQIDPPEDRQSLEDRLCGQERTRELLRALERIHPDYREALYLLYFEELSLDETARVMKKTKKQVENLSYRGRAALREQLEKEAL